MQIQQSYPTAEVPSAHSGPQRKNAHQGSSSSLNQAAKLVDINYSTAKTIIFFHRNHSKSYQFDFKITKTKAIISGIEAIVS